MYKRQPYALSLIFILAGVISLLLTGLNLGIDFAGGTVFHLNLTAGFTLAEVEDVAGTFPELKLSLIHISPHRPWISLNTTLPASSPR